MKELDGLVVMGQGTGADRMECTITRLALTSRDAARAVAAFGQMAAACWAMARKQSPHPPVGTPGPKTQGGNSTPARALVAVFQQSERSGEHRGRK